MIKIIFYIILILILYLLYVFYVKNNKSKLHKLYNDDKIDIKTKTKNIEKIKNKIKYKNPYDYYILGSYYLLYKNDKIISLQYFNKVINLISNFLHNLKNKKINSNIHKENIFILESIYDLEKIYFNDSRIYNKTKFILIKYYNYLNNLHKLKFLHKLKNLNQLDNLNQLNQINNLNNLNNLDPPNQLNPPNSPNQTNQLNYLNQQEQNHQEQNNNNTNENKENKILKNINDKKFWISDSQNVHDSFLSDEFVQQYELIHNQNNQNNQNINYKNIIDFFHLKCNNEIEKTKLNKFTKILDNNYKFDNNINEQDVLIEIWKRSLDPKNKDNKDNIQNALFDNMLDCIENNNVVCIRGRTPKLWQSLALLDYNKNIGILKSKQLIKNEIYEKCGKIINDTINLQPKNIINAYNNYEVNEEIINLKNKIYNLIDEVKNDYKGKLLDIQLECIINECKELV